MADFTNRQLADIISVVGDKISKDLKKNEYISKAISENLTKSETIVAGLNEKIEVLKKTVLKPDLSEVNSLYETKTAENIKRINSKLSIPNVALYTWFGALVLFLISASMLHLAYATAVKTKAEYRTEFFKENIIISKEKLQLFNDMDRFFSKNPKTKEIFIKTRKPE